MDFKKLLQKTKAQQAEKPIVVGVKLAEEQLEALERMEDFLDSPEPVLVLQGYAGTGKTSILNEYIQFLDSTSYPFVLCAPTHKAKLVMETVTGYSAVTVHKLLSLAPNIEIFNLDYRDLKFYSSGESGEIPDDGVVIIDEASMINDEIYKLLLEFCNKYNAKLLFIGDKAQIQAVCNQGVSKVFECENIITLTKIHRQAETNGLLPLLKDLREKPMSRFKSIEAEEGSLTVFKDDARGFLVEAIEQFTKAIKNQNVTETKIIAYTNARVQGFNQSTRKLLWGTRAANEFNKFEILTGYDNFEFNKKQFYNSLDYVILSVDPVDKHIPYFTKLPGFNLSLYDTVYKESLDVFVLSRNIPSDRLDSLAATIENLRIGAIEAKNQGNRTRSSYLWKKYFEISKSFALSKDLMWDNRVIKKKTFDYGYASTVHKV